MFNALTKNNVLAANYPFATIDPNVGVVPLPDERLARLAEIFGSEKILPATVSFVDIAGIVRGASEGEGLGNKFLANIREADAICQVVRAFEDGDVVHVDGKVSPSSDIETIHTELILADLQTLEKAVTRLEKESRIKKESKPAYENALAAQKVLEEGNTLYAAGAAAGVDLALAVGSGPAHHQAVHLRLQPRRGAARRRRPARPAGCPGRPGRRRVPQRQARDGPHGDVRGGRPRDAPVVRRRGVRPRPAGAGRLPHPRACRPTSRPGPRSRGPGPSTRAGPPRRPRASSTPTSSAASSRPRSSRSPTWMPPARWPRRARPGGCAWRARST